MSRILVVFTLASAALLAVAAAPSAAAELAVPQAPAAEVPAAAEELGAATPVAAPELPVAPAAAPAVLATSPETPAVPDVPASPIQAPPEGQAQTLSTVGPPATPASQVEVPAVEAPRDAGAAVEVPVSLTSASDNLPQTDGGLASQLAEPSAIAKTPAIAGTPTDPQLPLIGQEYSADGIDGTPIARERVTRGEGHLGPSPISITVSRISSAIFGGVASLLQDALLSSPGALAGQTTANSTSSQTTGDGANGPAPAPAQLPFSAPSFTSSSGFYFFGFAALLVALLGLRAPALSRDLTGSPVGWRPAPYLLLLERPG